MSENINIAEQNITTNRIREKIKELNGKILDDMALINKEISMTGDSYSSVISGARKRISRNRILLFQYKKALKRLM